MVAGCSSWFRTGNVPLSATPLTNEKLLQRRRRWRSAARSRRAGRRSSSRLAVRCSACSVAATTWRSRSTIASSTAASVRPGLPAQPRRRVHVGELARRDGSGREQVRASAVHGCTGAPAKNALDRRLRAAAEVAAEHRVAGVRDDEQLRVRDLRGDRAARRRSACAGPGAPERISVGTFGSAPARRRRRRGVGPGGAHRHEAVGQRGRRVERVEVGRRQRAQRAERFGQARRAGGAALPREQRLLARRRR